MSRWLVGSSRISTFAPRVHEDGQRQPPALSAGQAGERLLGLLPGEQERPSSARALLGVSPVRAGWRRRRSARRPAHAQLFGMLGEVADGDVVAGAQASAGERALPGERLDEGRLAHPVGPDERYVLTALEPQLGLLEQ